MLTEKELRNRLKNSEFFYYKKNSKTLSRKERRQLKRYGYLSQVAWNADNADNQKLANSLKNVHEQIYDFYHALKAIPDLSDLALFFRHTYNILSIYKKNSPVVMTYHHAEIATENIHLEGNQQFLLDWLLERLRIIMASDGERQREHVIKFFDVWSEIYGLFWW
jgi:hypothetical protein